MTKEEAYEVIENMLLAEFGDSRVLDKFCEILAKKIKDQIIALLIEEGLEKFIVDKKYDKGGE